MTAARKDRSKFCAASPEELQRMIDASIAKRRKEFGAAPTTVEALMYSLRERGEAALKEPDCQRRLSELIPDQIIEVHERLDHLRSKYPAITDKLLRYIAELIK
jgi:hypothetical protein